MDILKKVNYIFNAGQKFRLSVLMVIMLIGSGLELIGIAAILPFVKIISDTSIIHNNKICMTIYRMFNMNNDTQFILLLAIGLIVLYIFKNAFVIWMGNLQYRFTYHNQQKFSKIMMDCYMKQPYLYHVTRNISEIHRNITGDVSCLFTTILAVIQLSNEMVVCLLLLIYLFVLDKYITLGLALMLGAFAIFFLKVMKKKAAYYGIKIRDYTVEFNKWIRQAFEGIKEVKIVNREQYYIDNMDNFGSNAAEVNIKMQTINAMPRPLFEAAVITALMTVVTAKIIHGADLQYFVPVLSAFAVAAFRILPSAGRITTFITAISYNKAGVENVYNDLLEIDRLQKIKREEFENKELIPFDDKISLEGVTFKYPSSVEPVLEGVSFEINKNKSIALIGPSGAGKTTLADIILGLLEPQEGHIYCDGEDVYKKLFGWHSLLGYIPQTIYLIDDTIRNNILFGIPENEADDEKVWKALEDAQLADFVKSLEEGLNTVVGERGVRLSGGQRQRIGIARALYNNPQILVLDEATSALDSETETAVMEAIDALHGNRTMIIIAHRLTTIKNCDYIYEIKDKKASLKNKEEVFGEEVK